MYTDQSVPMSILTMMLYKIYIVTYEKQTGDNLLNKSQHHRLYFKVMVAKGSHSPGVQITA